MFFSLIYDDKTLHDRKKEIKKTLYLNSIIQVFKVAPFSDQVY